MENKKAKKVDDFSQVSGGAGDVITSMGDVQVGNFESSISSEEEIKSSQTTITTDNSKHVQTGPIGGDFNLSLS